MDKLIEPGPNGGHRACLGGGSGAIKDGRKLGKPNFARRMLVGALLVGFTLGLTGCAASVDEVAVALTTAENVAEAYKTLPTCVSGGAPVCSTPAIITKIKAADTVAYNDLALLEANTGSVTTATVLADIAALNSLIPATK